MTQRGDETLTATSTNPKSAPSLKDENRSARPLAIVTGASAGIGYELARKCAAHGFDLLIATDDPKLIDAAREFELLGGAGVRRNRNKRPSPALNRPAWGN